LSCEGCRSEAEGRRGTCASPKAEEGHVLNTKVTRTVEAKWCVHQQHTIDKIPLFGVE